MSETFTEADWSAAAARWWAAIQKLSPGAKWSITFKAGEQPE